MIFYLHHKTGYCFLFIQSTKFTMFDYTIKYKPYKSLVVNYKVMNVAHYTFA